MVLGPIEVYIARLRKWWYWAWPDFFGRPSKSYSEPKEVFIAKSKQSLVYDPKNVIITRPKAIGGKPEDFCARPKASPLRRGMGILVAKPKENGSIFAQRK